MSYESFFEYFYSHNSVENERTENIFYLDLKHVHKYDCAKFQPNPLFSSQQQPPKVRRKKKNNNKKKSANHRGSRQGGGGRDAPTRWSAYLAGWDNRTNGGFTCSNIMIWALFIDNPTIIFLCVISIASSALSHDSWVQPFQGGHEYCLYIISSYYIMKKYCKFIHVRGGAFLLQNHICRH